MIVGGDFTSIGNVNLNRIGSWNGSNWQPLGGGINGDVFSLSSHKNELYAGGTFTTAGGVVVDKIAKWNGTQWVHPGFTLEVYPQAMASFEGKLYIGGFNYLKVWDGTNLIDIPVNSTVSHLLSINGVLHVGGSFSTIDNRVSSRLAILDSDSSPLHCLNGIKDEDEQYVDCGGSCIPCTDCSHSNVTISDRPMADNLFIRASGVISSSGSISQGATTIFQAQLATELIPEFECNGGLIVQTGSCN